MHEMGNVTLPASKTRLQACLEPGPFRTLPQPIQPPEPQDPGRPAGPDDRRFNSPSGDIQITD